VTADNVGEVIEPNTQAWVGTRLGAVETPLWHVKMRKNEQVEILGEVSWPHPEGHSTIWYQIAPPAGEFRWVQISDLQLPPSKRSTPPTQASSIAITDPQSSQASDRNRRVSAEARLNTTNDRSTGVRTASLQQIVPPVNRQRPSDFASQASAVRPLTNDGATNADPQNLGWRRSTRPIPASDSAALAGEFSDQDSHIRTASNGDRNRFWSSEQSYDSRKSSANQAAAPPTDRFASLADPRGFRADRRSSFSNAQLDARPGAGRSFALSGQSIEQLELQLTNQLLQQPQTWQLTPILSAAQSLYRSAPTAIDQQRAARLIEKCQNGQRLQAGFSTAESPASVNTLPFGNRCFTRCVAAKRKLRHNVRCVRLAERTGAGAGGVGSHLRVAERQRKNHTPRDGGTRFEFASICQIENRDHWPTWLRSSAEARPRHRQSRRRAGSSSLTPRDFTPAAAQPA
jgi:hypothetical protein